MRGRRYSRWRRQLHMQRPRRQAERPQVRRSVIRGDCIRHIHQRLWQLPYGNCGHASIRGRIDRLHTVAVFQTNINATSITRAPDAVREVASLDGRDQLRLRAWTTPIDQHLVPATDRYVCKPSGSIRYEGDVIGNRPSFEHCQRLKGRLRADNLRLARVLQSNPDLILVDGKTRRKRTRLRHACHDLVSGRLDDIHLGSKTGWHKGELTVRTKKNHAWTICSFDPPHLFLAQWVDYTDIVLAAYGYPQFAAIRAEERLVRRTAHVDLTFHRVRFGVDQRDGVRANRNNSKRPVIRRKTETMHQQFATVQRAQRRGNVFAQMD